MQMCADGEQGSAEAATLLESAGFSGALQLEGGYDAYTQVWSPSGKRRPPAGRWVSTGALRLGALGCERPPVVQPPAPALACATPAGKEALKSGLNIPGVAEAYDEGGNLQTARYAEGLPPGKSLLDP